MTIDESTIARLQEHLRQCPVPLYGLHEIADALPALLEERERLLAEAQDVGLSHEDQ